MANPYLSKDIVPSIAAEWQSKGYGTFKKLEDNTYLLYHIRAPNSHQYHIHIGDSKNDNRMGFATLKQGGIHTIYYEGLNNGKYTATQWADYLWIDTGYSTYSGG